MSTLRQGATLAAVVFGVTAVTPAVQAQVAGGFAVNRFDPSERGSDWFWAESLDLRGHNRWAVGVVGDWAYKPLVAYDAAGNEVTAPVRHQVTGHFGASVVLWERLRLGVSVPLVVYQTGDGARIGNTDFLAPTSGAFGDVRLGADLRLLGRYGSPGTLAIGVHVHLPTGSRDTYTGDDETRIAPRMTFAGDAGIFTYAAKTGLNIRPKDRSFGPETLGTEWFFGGALGLRLADRNLTIGPEVWASTLVTHATDGPFDTQTTPVEGIFGAHYTIADAWRIGAGIGPGFTRSLGNPTLRTLLSLEWFPSMPPDPVRAPTPEPAPVPVVVAPLDTDRDGVPDAEDACPTVVGLRTNDPLTNGCPPPVVVVVIPPPVDPDSDKDGIPDAVDACPTLPGVKTNDPRSNGCPIAHIEGRQVKIYQRIEFETEKAKLDQVSIPVLEAVLQILTDHPEITLLQIDGHTDNRGTAAFNKPLSNARANSVKKWLTDHGINPARLQSAGHGFEQPIETNDTDAGRQNNRRVEFNILKTTEGGASAEKP